MNKKICTVEECNNPVHAKGLCQKHRSQLRRYGTIKSRTMFDLNEIIIKGDVAEVVYYNRKSEPLGVFVIDTEDVDKIKNMKWHVTTQGYVKSNRINLHRFLMEPIPKGMTIDHINRNTLDNRRSHNLRYASRSLQNQNRKTPHDVEKRKIKISINGMRYDSLAQAFEATNIPIETMRGWLKGAKPRKPEYKNLKIERW